MCRAEGRGQSAGGRTTHNSVSKSLTAIMAPKHSTATDMTTLGGGLIPATWNSASMVMGMVKRRSMTNIGMLMCLVPVNPRVSARESCPATLRPLRATVSVKGGCMEC